jgi:hypothetical protein
LSLKDRVYARYLHLLVASARGRAFVMAQAGDSEACDEVMIFDLLLEKVDDAELRGMIAKHKADELRHADMFHERAARIGAPVAPLPDELMFIRRMDRALDGFLGSTIAGAEGVMNAYLLLQVIEERAVTQFGMLVPVMRIYDAESAEVVAAVMRDEERHIKYCRAISRRYAPDQATLARALRRMREIELDCFARHSRANLRYTLERGLIEARPWQYALWRLVSRHAPMRPELHRTRFWNQARA